MISKAPNTQPGRYRLFVTDPVLSCTQVDSLTMNIQATLVLGVRDFDVTAQRKLLRNVPSILAAVAGAFEGIFLILTVLDNM